MLTKRYMATVKNLPAIFEKIITGTAPEKFNVGHLKGLGFSSSNDRAIIPLLKDLGFLTADGTPTKRYHDYRNQANSKKVLGEALQESYQEIFHINAHPTASDRSAIEGKFKSTHNVTDVVAQRQAMTFFALLKLAEVTDAKAATTEASKLKPEKAKATETVVAGVPRTLRLRYNIEVHLPATKDIEVYNAIFRSLKENLLD